MNFWIFTTLLYDLVSILKTNTHEPYQSDFILFFLTSLCATNVIVENLFAMWKVTIPTQLEGNIIKKHIFFLKNNP